MNHCHFSEDDGDNVETSDWEDPITDLDKRKVVQYIAFVDDFDGEYEYSYCCNVMLVFHEFASSSVLFS